VLSVSVVLSGDESREVADDKLAEAAADAVKRNGVLTNQLEVHTTTTVIQANRR